MGLLLLLGRGEVLNSVTTSKVKTDPRLILDADLWVVGLL
jgi:hypothetical protein